MNFKINGKRVFYSAVETFYFDEKSCSAVIRTVSGEEHAKTVKDEDEAEVLFDRLEQAMALFGSM